MIDTRRVELDQNHVWGEYRELLVAEEVLCRVIRFCVGGRTSIHRHDVSESLVIESGRVRCAFGHTLNTMEEVVLAEGDLIRIPSGVWHACSCEEPASNGAGYALAFEFITGDVSEGMYEIIRAEPAIPHSVSRH